MLGVQGHVPRENFDLIDAIWSVLMYFFFIRFSLKNVPLFISVIAEITIYVTLIIIATHQATLLLWVILLPEKFEKTCSS